MNPDTMQLKELEPDTAPPEGFLVLPPELQAAAASLAHWAKPAAQVPAAAPTSTKATRAKRKQERQNRRAGRSRR